MKWTKKIDMRRKSANHPLKWNTNPTIFLDGQSAQKIGEKQESTFV